MSFAVEAPDGWIQSKVGHFCDVQLGKMLQSEPSSDADELKRYLRAINVSKKGVNFDHRFEMWVKPQELQKYALRYADVLVSEGGDAGRTAHFLSHEESYFQNAINRIRPQATDRLEARFIYYWFTFLKLAGYVGMVCNVATLAHFTAEKVSSAPFLLPPIDTQKKIVGFLDEKTVQIDGLIEKKRALLDRLSEKRQALITQAVTKGLKADAPMKNSGIDWLGQVPEHWDVKRLNSFCEFQSGKAHEPFIEPDGEYVCVNARFISTNGDAAKRCTENLTPALVGDILMVMSDLPNGRALARTFLVDDKDKYAVNQRVCRIRPKDGNPTYYTYLLNRNPQLMRHNDGKEQTHLSNSAFKMMKLFKPPLPEQDKIASYLDDLSEKMATTQTQIEASLDRLLEYRAALISSAVTGKIEGLQ